MSKLTNIVQRLKFESRTLFNELRPNCIPINSYAWMNYDGSIDHSNWGDDINWYFLQEIIEGNLIPYAHARLTKLLHRPNYVVIGSTIDLSADADSIIWGAGIIDSKTASLPNFKEIRAVRGPLTRMKLIEMGIDCPEIYGDPALLIPLHYNPIIEKKYKLGVIPHFHDIEAARAIWHEHNDIKFINIRRYNHWHDFIDEILSCETIASSSLHGLIMSHAFNIPNVWVEFRGGESRDPFKYNDFFSSIGKTATPILLDKDFDVSRIDASLAKWTPGSIDLNPLIQSAPFKLKL